jgi:acyl carrier protein
MSSDVAEKLRQYLIEDLDVEVDAEDLTADFPLSGRVDSLGLLEMVSFIEEEFGVSVSNSELTPQNFDSLGGMVRLVESKLNSSV